MDQLPTNKPFNKRAFSSIVLLLSGFTLPVSGLMCHLLQNEELIGARHYWMSVHNGAGILFVMMAILHVSLNWRSLRNYMKKSKEFKISKEAIFALLLFLIIIGLQPFHGI